MGSENQNLFSPQETGSLGDRRQVFLKRIGDLCEEKDAWKGRGKALPRRTLVELTTIEDVVSLAQYLGSVGEAPIRVTFEMKEHNLRRTVGESMLALKAEEDAGKPDPMVALMEAQKEAQAEQMKAMMAMMAVMMGGQTPAVTPAPVVVEAAPVEAPAVETPAEEAK